jgi:hypothetical protein
MLATTPKAYANLTRIQDYSCSSYRITSNLQHLSLCCGRHTHIESTLPRTPYRSELLRATAGRRMLRYIVHETGRTHVYHLATQAEYDLST